MVELLNILLNSSRELTDNEQYGYYVRELLEESKNEVGDIKKLNLLSKNIIKQIKHNEMMEIPTHDPQTGELNPYYEELTGKKNPLTKEQIDDIIYLRKNLMKGLKIPPTKDKDLDKMPNQKWHQIVSFIKSGVRIIGYCLIPYNLLIAAIVLVISEVIGVIEELV